MRNFFLFLLVFFTSTVYSSNLTIPPTAIMNAVSLAASVDSQAVRVLNSDNIGLQFVWTGDPTGTFGISGSNTATLLADGSITGGTWTAITGTYPAPAGAGGNYLVSVTNYPYAFIKVTYTRASGSGAVTVTLVAKPI